MERAARARGDALDRGVLALSRDTAGHDGPVLVLRALGLGDFLTGVPALRALRRGFPERELVLAAPRALSPLVDLAGVVDRLEDTRGLEGVRAQEPAPSLAVNLHGKGPQSHELLRALHPERLVAFACAEAGHRGPEWRPDEHEVQRWCRLLHEELRLPVDPADLRLQVPDVPSVAPGAVVVHPGAAFASRRWPAERYAAVARRLSSEGHDVVVTGGPQERQVAEDVAAAAGLPGSAVLAGRTDLAELAAMTAHARLVVCGDTGTAHLATAYSTPSVVLFGPVSPEAWGPPQGTDSPHTVLWHGDGDGDPWGERPDPALLAISVEEVVAAAQSALSAARRTTPASA